MHKKLISAIILLSLVVLASCASQKTETNNDNVLEKCIETFKLGKSPDGKEMPAYLKETLAKEACKKILEDDQKRFETFSNSIYGMFTSQDIILNKNGGTFEIRIKNSNSPGDFKVNIEEPKTSSGNSLAISQKEYTFSLNANEEKIIAVSATPTISPSYKLPQDYFTVKITAAKNNAPFQETQQIITINDF
ncbi:hypothetical protein J4231_00785 [Candidatus Woesearchaeota archaeon]|nr:hypothetical protein [Candidatus Woesearchaeota archaeon]